MVEMKVLMMKVLMILMMNMKTVWKNKLKDIIVKI